MQSLQHLCELKTRVLENWRRCVIKLNLEIVDGDPRIRWEILQHGYKKLQTAVPVTEQQHHTDEVEDAHEHPGYVQKLST